MEHEAKDHLQKNHHDHKDEKGAYDIFGDGIDAPEKLSENPHVSGHPHASGARIDASRPAPAPSIFPR